MARIVLSYSVHKTEASAPKLVPDVASELRKKGHEVVLIKLKESNVAEYLQLARAFALFEAFHSPEKHEKNVLARLSKENPWLSKMFIDMLDISSRMQKVGLINETKKMKKILKISRKQQEQLTRRQLKSRLSFIKKVREIIHSRITSGLPLKESISQSLCESQDRFSSKLLKAFPEHHIFDFHNSPIDSMFVSDAEASDKRLSPKKTRQRICNLAFQRLKKFRPNVVHLSAHESHHYSDLKHCGILFLHHSRTGSANEREYYHANPPKYYFVGVELPAIFLPSKGLMSKRLSDPYSNLYLRSYADHRKTADAGLLRNTATGIAKEIDRMMTRGVKVRKEI